MHYRNIQAIAIDMFKVANGMSPVIINEIFQLREESHFNLPYKSNFVIPPIQSGSYGSELRHIWDLKFGN